MENPDGDPTFPEGTCIVVDPDKKPAAGDKVVVMHPRWELPLFKIYCEEQGLMVLRSLNPKYLALIPPQDAKVLGVVVHSLRDA